MSIITQNVMNDNNFDKLFRYVINSQNDIIYRRYVINYIFKN